MSGPGILRAPEGRVSGAWSGWVAAMGEVGGGEWYCRGWRVPVSLWSASLGQNWASLLGEGVCGVWKGAPRPRNAWDR